MYTFNAGTNYKVLGRMVVDGTEYLLIPSTAVSQSLQLAALVSPNGTLSTRMSIMSPSTNRSLAVSPGTSTRISDPSVRFIRSTTQVVKEAKGYQNFELLYTGISSNALALTYREFSPEGLARVAFFQNLSYEPDAKVITFRKYRIAIEKATSEAITFSVLSD